VSYLREKEFEKKLNSKISDLNNALFNALKILKQGNNLFRLSSAEKSIKHLEIKPRDLINMTLRINKNYSAPFGDLAELPDNYLSPYPIEEREMRATILKFNMNPSQRLKSPKIKPSENIVAKGTPLEISYPEPNIRDIFFRYCISEDMIPTYFNGERVKYLINQTI